MRGRTGLTLGLFALMFVGMGALFGSFISPDVRYTWPGVFHVVFIMVGAVILAIAAYGAVRNWSFYTTADNSVIEWGRADLSKKVGSVRIAELAKIVLHTEGMDTGFDVLLIDKSDGVHKISGEFLFSDSEAKRLLSFVRQNFPDIEVIQK